MANIKITGYAELAAPISTDLIEVVSDPGGTPISKKVQIRNLFKGGGQIAFPATAVPSADANTLDDYEEGTFTPTWTPASGSGQTVNLAAGFYTKTGNRASIQFSLGTNGHGTASGSVTIGGLPFVSSNVSNSYSLLYVGQSANMAITAGFSVCGIISVGTTIIEPLLWDVTTGTSTLQVSEWGVSGVVRFSSVYQIL